jgi:hypothetical protein
VPDCPQNGLIWFARAPKKHINRAFEHYYRVCNFQSFLKIVHFWMNWARPHKGFRRGVHVSTPQAETRGERSPGEKEPFLDGN